MRIGSALCCERKMAVAMQMEDFPYLPSGPAEGMLCQSYRFIQQQQQKQQKN